MKIAKYILVLTLSASAAFVSGQPASENASPKAGEEKKFPPIPKFADAELPESLPQGNAKWGELQSSMARTRDEGKSPSKQDKKNAADRAQQFYLEHPDHPKARRARKLEIDSLLTLDDGTDSTVHPRLKSRVSDFRKNRSIPANERAQVAKMFDMREVTRNASVGLDHQKAYEKVARDIAAEFAEAEDGEQMLLSLAQKRGNRDGLKIARELAKGAKTARAKKSATELQTRLELVGQPLAKVLPSVVKKRDSGDGRLTVIYSWSTEVPGSMATAKLLGARASENADWIGVNLDQESGLETARSIAEKDAFPGTQLYAIERNHKTVPRKLGMGEAGLVYLVDSEGLIFDVQVHQDLMNMITSFGL